MHYNCSNLYILDMRSLKEQVKTAFCYQKLFWPFTVWTNCSCDLKNFENSRPSTSNFKSFFRSLDNFFLTEGQNNFGHKIPLRHPYSLYRRSFIVFTYYLFKDWSAFVINVSYDDIMYIEISSQDIYVTRMEVKKRLNAILLR